MQIKKNKFLISIVCIIICFLLMNYFQLISFPFLFLGIAFLFLYKEKRKNWSLFCGSIMIIICLGNLFFRIPLIGRNIFRTLLLLFFSIVLFYYYKQSKNENFLVPACFFLWGGIYTFAVSFSIFAVNACAMLFIFIGMAFFTVYFMKKEKSVIWPVILSMILFILGFLFMKDNKMTSFPVYILSLLLILSSVIAFIRAFIHKF